MIFDSLCLDLDGDLFGLFSLGSFLGLGDSLGLGWLSGLGGSLWLRGSSFVSLDYVLESLEFVLEECLSVERSLSEDVSILRLLFMHLH